MFNLGSSYFHVPLTTVRHLLNDGPDVENAEPGLLPLATFSTEGHHI